MNNVQRSIAQRMGKPWSGYTGFEADDKTRHRIKKAFKGKVDTMPYRAGVEDIAETSVKRFSKDWFKKYGGWGALNAVGAVMDYNSTRSEGKGPVGSLASAAGWFVAGEMLGAKMIPLMLGAQLPGLAVSAVSSLEQMSRNMAMTEMYKNTPFFNARFQDTQPAYTMRQAGMQQMQNSQYRLEQAMMGNEAQYMKR